MRENSLSTVSDELRTPQGEGLNGGEGAGGSCKNVAAQLRNVCLVSVK